MKRKLLLLTAFVVSALTGMRAQTDVTSTYITNPSFETDEAISDLKNCGWATDRATGWTISPSAPQNSQDGVGNATSTLQGIGTTHAPASGDKFFYFRNNWNRNVKYAISQTISNLPAGTYKLMVKAAYYASENSTFALSAKEGDSSEQAYTVSGKGSSDAPWETWFVIIKKASDETDLTIEASLKAGGASSGQHYNLLLDDFQLLKLDVDPVEPMQNETSYYLFNEATSQFLSAGGTWGTHAFADETGIAMKTTLNNGSYTLSPEEFSGKNFSGLYVDGTATTPWFFIETSTGSGKYYMTQDAVNYLASNGKNAELVNVENVSNAAEWTIVSKTERINSLSTATVENPVNATFLIADPNFGRNNTAYSSWKWTFPNGENKNNSGDNTNFVVECFQKQFTFEQDLAADDVPVGVYSLTAQGFYRQDGNDNDHLPVFFANDETQTFPLISGGENSMAAASNSFKNGSYTIEPIYVRIEQGEGLSIGAKSENEKLWCIWDNFQLKYYGDVTLASVIMAEKVSAYEQALASAQSFVNQDMFEDDKSLLSSAIADNTLDLNASGLTEEQLVTATENLNSAIEAANNAVDKYTTYNTAVSTINGGTNVNLSSLIKNNGFEQGNMNGWTNSGAQQAAAQGNKAFDNTQGNYYAERWHANGIVDVNQTISCLPAGIYEISAYLYTDTSDGKFYVNETEVPFSTSKKYTAVVEIDDKASIKLGAICTLTSSTWICMDEFTMTYIGTADDLQYTLADGKMGTDKRAAQTTAENTFNNDKTLENYNALLTAIGEAEASVKNYQNLKAAIDKANEIKEANNVVTASALTEFEGVISDATSGWENEGYTDADCLNEISVLGTSVSGWHGNANGAAGKYIASAWDGGTDTWDNYYINTWSIEGDNDGTNFSVPFFEYYAGDTNNLGDKNMTATIPVENGGYEVEAWVRIEERSDAALNSGSADKLKMTVNDGTPVTLVGEKIGNSRMYIGRFSTVGEVTDGNLVVKISVTNGSNAHWLCFRDVKYKKIDGVSMSVKAGKYGTFIAPFNVTLPDGVKAYTVTDMDGSTLVMSPVEGSTLEANTAVVLENTTEENIAKEFFGKSVATEDTYKTGLLTGYYKPVLVAASTDAVSNYILQTQDGKQAFRKVIADYTTQTPNRAYLSVEGSSNVKSVFFPGQGDATGINAVSTLLGGDVEGIYTVGGAKVNSLQKGVNIIRTADGKTQKVLVK